MELHDREPAAAVRFQAGIRCAKALDRQFIEVHYRTSGPDTDLDKDENSKGER